MLREKGKNEGHGDHGLNDSAMLHAANFTAAMLHLLSCRLHIFCIP